MAEQESVEAEKARMVREQDRGAAQGKVLEPFNFETVVTSDQLEGKIKGNAAEDLGRHRHLMCVMKFNDLVLGGINFFSSSRIPSFP
jgi:hypothetical protein